MHPDNSINIDRLEDLKPPKQNVHCEVIRNTRKINHFRIQNKSLLAA